MSKLGTSLKPQVLTTISKITSTTQPECSSVVIRLASRQQYRHKSTYEATQSLNLVTVRNKARKELEDHFVGFLIQAGSCQQKRRTTCRVQPLHSKLQKHHVSDYAQARAIHTSTRKRAAMAAEIRLDDDTTISHHPGRASTTQEPDGSGDVRVRRWPQPNSEDRQQHGTKRGFKRQDSSGLRQQQEPRIRDTGQFLRDRKTVHEDRPALDEGTTEASSQAVKDTQEQTSNQRRSQYQLSTQEHTTDQLEALSNTTGQGEARRYTGESRTVYYLPDSALRYRKSTNDSHKQSEDCLLDTMTILPLIPKERYMEMVDIYGMPMEEEAKVDTEDHPNAVPRRASNTAERTPLGPEPKSQQSDAETEHLSSTVKAIDHYPLAPRLTMSIKEEEMLDRRQRRLHNTLTTEHLKAIEELHHLLRSRPGHMPRSKLWKLYCQLPEPQVCYLTEKDVDRLFQHLGTTEYKSSQSAKERFFKLLMQCNEEGIDVHHHHWTTAISFAGRWARNVDTEHVREAIELWTRMEQHGKRADPIVFNVLFDIATKAGRFALADTIHNEMKAREMPLNRYFRFSMIYGAGMRKDGDAVRAAFNAFVAAGDIVDTGVMNLVIRSLIRSDEGEAAEHVFENMKTLHAEKFPSQVAATWQERRAMVKSLTKTATLLRKQEREHRASFFGSPYSNKERLEELQRLTPVHPDATSYRMIIGYHALVSGDIARIQELLQEMKDQGLHVHGSVYANLFSGFIRHGGFSFSAWTPEMLDHIWHEFSAAIPLRNVISNFSDDTGVRVHESELHELSMLSEDDRPVHYSVQMVMNILQAYDQCCGKRRMISVWKDVQSKWQGMNEEEESILNSYCRKLMRQHIWQD